MSQAGNCRVIDLDFALNNCPISKVAVETRLVHVGRKILGPLIARVSKLCALRTDQIGRGKNSYVHLHGKGRGERWASAVLARGRSSW
jgi:hypothetical protein